MDATIIAAIIGVFASIIASVGSFLCSNILSGLFRPKRRRKSSSDGDGDRKDSLPGSWRGIVRREESLGEPLEMHFPASFKPTDPSNPMIPGEEKLIYKDKGGTITGRLSIEGELVHERFLILEYKQEDHGVIQFGCVVLECNPDGETVDGRFVGFSVINRGIAWGTVHVERGKSRNKNKPMKPERSES